MRFGYSLDTMRAWWSPGDEDLITALLDIEGMAFHRINGGLADKERCAVGWDRKIVYVTKSGKRGRRMRREQKAEAAE